MKYASDNRAVRAVYAFTTGPTKLLFIGLLVAFVAVSIYVPVRDFYIAQRSQDILQQQVAIREKYKKALEKEVDTYLSKEGVQDAARKDLGMAMPGEKTITVEGLDENGNPVVEQSEKDGKDGKDSKAGKDAAKDEDAVGSKSSSGEPSTSAEVDAAEEQVYENSAWYWKVLDAIFFFDGTNGQAVTSTGSASDGSGSADKGND